MASSQRHFPQGCSSHTGTNNPGAGEPEPYTACRNNGQAKGTLINARLKQQDGKKPGENVRWCFAKLTSAVC